MPMEQRRNERCSVSPEQMLRSETGRGSLLPPLREAKRFINETRMVRRAGINYSPVTFFTFGRWSAQDQRNDFGALARTVGRTSNAIATAHFVTDGQQPRVEREALT